MQKPVRGFQDRANVPEFEENFEKIDAFRTHKYRQFGEKEIVLTTALSNEEIEIEANGIFIKYPVDAAIRVNDLDAPLIDCKHFRYIGGYVHKIYVTSPAQNPKLKILTGVDSELGFLSDNHFVGDTITGTSTDVAFTVYLEWGCQAFVSKHMLIKNTGSTHSMYYKVYGYIGSNAIEIGVGTIPAGEVKQLLYTEMYEKITVTIARGAYTATTFSIDYAGTTQYSNKDLNCQELLFDISNETTSHTVNGDSYHSLPYRFAEIALNCSSLTGSSDTLDVKVQAYNSEAALWHDIATFTQLTAAGTQVINLSEGLGYLIRGVYTTGGTVTDCDFKLGVVLKR